MILRPIVLIFFLLFALLLGACSTAIKKSEMADLHLKLGVSHLNKGSLPQAIRELRTAVELDPDSPLVHNNLAMAYYMREQLDSAESHFRRAVQLEPKYTDARNNLSRVLIDQGKFQEALKEVNAVINDLTYTVPEKAYINRGLLHFRMDNYELAKQDFARAISADRENCLAQNYYGRTLLELKDYAKAATTLDQATVFCRNSSLDEPIYFSALAYFRMGDVTKAKNRFQSLRLEYPRGQYFDKAQTMLDFIEK